MKALILIHFHLNVMMCVGKTFSLQGSSENLVVGAGGGQFGLWFDADLNKGRTQTCQTFNNPPLTPNSDFMVNCIECWAFLSSS